MSQDYSLPAYPLLRDFTTWNTLREASIVIPKPGLYEERLVPIGYFVLMQFMQPHFNQNKSVSIADLLTRFSSDTHACRFTEINQRFGAEPCQLLKALRVLYDAQVLTYHLTSADMNELLVQDVVEKSPLYDTLRVKSSYMPRQRRVPGFGRRG